MKVWRFIEFAPLFLLWSSQTEPANHLHVIEFIVPELLGNYLSY